MKAVKPWPAKTECPLEGFEQFKIHLMSVSYHNAAPGVGERQAAKTSRERAASLAIRQEWPYWVMERMFREIGPLESWDSFMQTYIELLMKKAKQAA